MAKKEKKQKEDTTKEEVLRFAVPGELLMGHYTNFASIKHTANEFVIDFFLRLSNEDISLVSRVLTSPEHAQLLLEALRTNIQKYEDQFGPIKKKTTRKKI